MAFFVVLVREQKSPRAPLRRNVTVEAGPFVRRAGAEYYVANRRWQDNLRQLPAGADELTLLCFIVEAEDAAQARALKSAASLVWAVCTYEPLRRGDGGAQGAGDRAPRPGPRGGLPSLVATRPLPLGDDGLLTRFEDEIRAYPADWDERRMR